MTSDNNKILIVSKSLEEVEQVVGRSIAEDDSMEWIPSATEAISRLFQQRYRGLYISESMLNEVLQERLRSDLHALVEILPFGIALLNEKGNIFWFNSVFGEIAQKKRILGEPFYQVLDKPEIGGPVFSPFTIARSDKKPVLTTIKNLHGKNYQFHLMPLLNNERKVHGFLVALEDITNLTIVNQKLQALHYAAGDLVDLTPKELLDMSVEDRIDLLKSNIARFIDEIEILEVNVVEIRLLNPETLELVPLLSIGMSSEAAARKLYASTENNGVTGFVAKLGKSYSIEDTQDDPLYIPGSQGAKSSFTVPLLFHDEVIGTLNVESPIPRAFSEIDELLIKVFARDVAMAIHTLDLLSAEKASSAAASVEAIHSEVALPIDQILNDAVSLWRYVGLAPELQEKFKRILDNARQIKAMIQRVGEKMTPAQAHPTPPDKVRPLLDQKRILVVDDDESVRRSAHRLLTSYGCIVEAATNGEDAFMMAETAKYDVFIGAIKLPDMDGYQFMLKLVDLLGIDPPPYIMMVGFGYDGNHTRVKANQRGLRGVLFKPFRLDQLLNTVEKVLSEL
ncbi:MAG: response regulator [Planctomycetaceae bacterium]|nr:response regulator [Planctomycetaceae bacterium]